MTARHVAFRVEGRVQGVGFRAGVERLARRHGLVGSVRNVTDGAVEGRVAGAPDAVDAFLAALPHAAASGRVDRLDVADLSDPPAAGFDVLPTGDRASGDWP